MRGQKQVQMQGERKKNSLPGRLLIPVVDDELSVNEDPRLSVTRHSELVISRAIW